MTHKQKYIYHKIPNPYKKINQNAKVLISRNIIRYAKWKGKKFQVSNAVQIVGFMALQSKCITKDIANKI